MPVHRVKSEIFFASLPSVVAALKRVVEHAPPKGYRCVNTQWDEKNSRLQTTLWPAFPLLLSTKLTFEVLGNDTPGSVKVIAGTESQPMIFGDVFGYYVRYLDHFLSKLRSEVGQVAVDVASPSA